MIIASRTHSHPVITYILCASVTSGRKTIWKQKIYTLTSCIDYYRYVVDGSSALAQGWFGKTLATHGFFSKKAYNTFSSHAHPRIPRSQ